MQDPSGVGRGSGFVAFTTPEEASRALSEMNGKIVISKPLNVALGQKKEERRARLQAQFSQLRPVAMPPSIAPRMPIYPPGAPSIGQQLFYGQALPGLIPQAGFGYQQQLVLGMRPGGDPTPHFFVPPVHQGQRTGRRGPGPLQQAQQPMPLMPQQMLPRGRMYRYPPSRNLQEVPMPGVVGGMLSAPYDVGGILPRDANIPQPMPITALASALTNATPEQQRTMLGENLYPLVDQLENEHATEVTGMHLEMDQAENSKCDSVGNKGFPGFWSICQVKTGQVEYGQKSYGGKKNGNHCHRISGILDNFSMNFLQFFGNTGNMSLGFLVLYELGMHFMLNITYSSFEFNCFINLANVTGMLGTSLC
ncbi:Polyadenylate-binding protein 8 [Abeliophyllum distichum]|uniref:Polyadenylate-binding protein 8 n=1 Tax=Abeliophyllum distichum TaxID=126358 RepID=A0ABD1TXQ2_9LAMI